MSPYGHPQSRTYIDRLHEWFIIIHVSLVHLRIYLPPCNVCFLDLPPRPSTSKSTPHAPLSLPASIGLGAGIGGGLFIVIIIVIIVVAARRWKKPGPLPPPVPRRYQPPASPPVSKHRIYENPDQTPGLIPTEWQTTAIDDTESIESLEYEVRSAQVCQVLRS